MNLNELRLLYVRMKKIDMWYPRSVYEKAATGNRRKDSFVDVRK